MLPIPLRKKTAIGRANVYKRFESHTLFYFQHGGWIGLTDAAVEGTYRWESDNLLVNYTHWATEEPNDFGGVEDCVTVWGGGSAGFWNDDYCDTEHYYICEKPEGKGIFVFFFFLYKKDKKTNEKWPLKLLA